MSWQRTAVVGGVIRWPTDGRTVNIQMGVGNDTLQPTTIERKTLTVRFMSNHFLFFFFQVERRCVFRHPVGRSVGWSTPTVGTRRVTTASNTTPPVTLHHLARQCCNNNNNKQTKKTKKRKKKSKGSRNHNYKIHTTRKERMETKKILRRKNRIKNGF